MRIQLRIGTRRTRRGKLKLSQFSVSRYRSILEAEKISVSDNTILIGRNNEGKSNILKGLNTAILSIKNAGYIKTDANRFAVRIRNRSGFGTDYNWDQDFPIPLRQKKSGDKRTRFRLDFTLSAEENAEFEQAIGIANNGLIPVEVVINSQNETVVSILKPGKGAASYNKKLGQICYFLARKLDFIYVPAVRTETQATEVVKSRLRKLLENLETDDEYKSAVDKIHAIQKPILDKLASDVKDQLVKFIPSIVDVTLDTSEKRIFSGISSNIDINIDDGVATSLESKGDGIKSLVALSLFNSTPSAGKSRIIAIEEPESHLHSGAVHQLRKTLEELSKTGQVVLTTHTAAFVDRQKLGNIVLVEHGKAARVKNISEIRQSLGILVSENLLNADFTVICEGESDRRILLAVMNSLSPKIRGAMISGSLVFEHLGGASKLSYKISSLNREVFETYAVLDYDTSGKNAIADAEEKGLIGPSDYSLVRLRGNADSEIDDSVKIDEMAQIFTERFGVNIKAASFTGNSCLLARLQHGFEASGKIWTKQLENQVKTEIASFIEEKPLERITPKARELFEAIAVGIESKLRSS